MEGLDFLFLNVTGGTNLSAPSAKRMRAHITKTNFAKRRRRLENISPVNEDRENCVSLYQAIPSSDDIDELPIASDGSAKVLSPLLPQQEPTRYGKECKCSSPDFFYDVN